MPKPRRSTFALLENPALIALKPDDRFGAILDRTGKTASRPPADWRISRPTSGVKSPNQPRTTCWKAIPAPTGGSEWVYRQTMSRLLRSLRLPYRFDVDFRCDLSDGEVAIGFTSAGVSMMPFTRYDVSRRAWIDLTDVERTRMSVDYNLRVGLMMAALSFGADPNVKRVSMHIDSIGLEEAVAEQDSAISE